MSTGKSAERGAAAVVGRPGAGKTLFVLHFAQWMGCRHVVLIRDEGPEGTTTRREFEPAQAVSHLVGSVPPTTRRLQDVEVRWRHRKRAVCVRLTDTVGLTDEIHPDPVLRRAMADSLTAVLESPIVLHMVDGPIVAADPHRLLDDDALDAQIERYGRGRRGYAVLVNKLDLPNGREALQMVRKAWPHQAVLGISALEGWGFSSVRRFLQRFI